MLRPRRFAAEIDPGPVQIQARKVRFDVADAALHWIPGHPVASHVVSVLNIVLPAGERWFVQTFNEALPLVTCRTRVLAGTVDHRDTLLTDPERAAGMLLTCVSRAADGSVLTLDL